MEVKVEVEVEVEAVVECIVEGCSAVESQDWWGQQVSGGISTAVSRLLSGFQIRESIRLQLLKWLFPRPPLQALPKLNLGIC